MATPEFSVRPDVDMSPEGIAHRLRTVSDLRDLWLSLRRATPVEQQGSTANVSNSPTNTVFEREPSSGTGSDGLTE